MPTGGISNKRQVRSLSQQRRNKTINKTKTSKNKNRIMPPNHQLEPDAGPTRVENPGQERGHHQKNVQSERLHRIKPHVLAETRVSDNAQIEREESNEAGERDGSVEGQ